MKIYRTIFSLIFFFAIQTTMTGQPGKLLYYFDINMNITQASFASYIGIGVKEDGKLKFSTYRLPSNTVLMKGYFTDSTLAVKNGLFTYYDSLGFTVSQGIFKNDMEEGYWLFWKEKSTDYVYYEKGVQIAKVPVSYHEGSDKLESRTFHDYKQNTRETWQWDTARLLVSRSFWKGLDGETYKYYPSGKVKEIERNPTGEESSSSFYSETGEDITKQFPKKKGKRNFKLTSRYISIRYDVPFILVTINFMLDKSGNAKDVDVKGVPPDMAAEVIALIGRMPSWKMNGLKSYGPIKILLNIPTINY